MVLISLSMKRRSEITFSTGAMAVGISFAVLTGLTIVSWLSTQATGGDFWSSPLTRSIVGVVTSINLIHFWIDAFIWKFSDAEIRKQHGEAFAF